VRIWVAAALLLLTGCSEPAVACTEIGAPSGVSVTVLAPYAAEVDALGLTVCWAGADCVDGAVELAPGSDTVDQGCSGSAPDDACSATAVPNGTLVGFLDVAGLPAGSVTVEGSVTVDGEQRNLAEITKSAETTFPNGAACPPGGNQLSVQLDADGLS
jgi:hypothetical protein